MGLFEFFLMRLTFASNRSWAMSDSQQEKIDEFCERFERAWQEGSVPPDLQSSIIEFPLADPGSRSNLLLEMVQIDLERRWRYPEKARDSYVAIDDSSTLLVRGTLADSPVAEEYLGILGIHPKTCPWLIDLLEAEFEIRHQWGDCPVMDHYLARFPEHAGTIKERLGSIDLPPRPRLQIRKTGADELAVDIPINRPVTLGRQRSGEPGPYATVNTDDGCRVIVVEADEKRVSRDEIRIEVRPRSHLRLTNTRQRGSIELVHRDKLSAGESIDITPPIAIRFPNEVVLIDSGE